MFKSSQNSKSQWRQGDQTRRQDSSQDQKQNGFLSKFFKGGKNIKESVSNQSQKNRPQSPVQNVVNQTFAKMTENQSAFGNINEVPPRPISKSPSLSRNIKTRNDKIKQKRRTIIGQEDSRVKSSDSLKGFVANLDKTMFNTSSGQDNQKTGNTDSFIDLYQEGQNLNQIQTDDKGSHKQYRKSKFPEELIKEKSHDKSKTELEKKKMSYILVDDDLMAVIDKLTDEANDFGLGTDISEQSLRANVATKFDSDKAGHSNVNSFDSTDILSQLKLDKSHIVNGGAFRKADNTEKRRNFRVKFSGFDQIIAHEDYMSDTASDKEDLISESDTISLENNQESSRPLSERRKTGLPDGLEFSTSTDFLTEENDDLSRQLKELELFAEQLPKSKTSSFIQNEDKQETDVTTPQSSANDQESITQLNMSDFFLNSSFFNDKLDKTSPDFSKDLPSTPQHLLRQSMNTPPPPPISKGLSNLQTSTLKPQDLSRSSSTASDQKKKELTLKKKPARRHVQIQARPVTVRSVGCQASFPAEGKNY